MAVGKLGCGCDNNPFPITNNKLKNNNMTKISVFGDEPTKERELKGIEFVLMLIEGVLIDAPNSPSAYDNIELIGRGYKYDKIDAWDDNATSKATYLGHWNDGVL